MLILHTEASMGWGGQEIRILSESAGIKERGHDVIIAAHPESSLLQNAKKEKFRTIPIDFKKRNFYKIVPYFKKLIEEEKIEVVNTHSSKDSWLVLPAARLADNMPLVVRTRHLSTQVHKGLLSRLLYNYLPHFIVTTGRAIKEQLVSVNGFDADKIVSIPTGVDTNIFRPDNNFKNLREELSIPLTSPLIGMVSVLRSWKGHVDLIHAVPNVMNKIPDARFVIAGEGPYRSTIEKAIDDAGIGEYIYLLGHREDVAYVMASLDILVHPSYANEGVPQSILQAMAMLKPVIATDLMPLREVVRDGVTGTITSVRDPESMASDIVRVLERREQSYDMCKKARRLMEDEYSYDMMLNKIENLYSGR
jgi:glycosyltransferase involved in cell wall biosynthesis